MIGSYHELWNIEKSFRMSKSELRARPVFRRERDSIEAHLTIVFAALAVTRFIEHRSGWSIRKFVCTARRYRAVQIRAGKSFLTAEDPLRPTSATLSPASGNTDEVHIKDKCQIEALGDLRPLALLRSAAGEQELSSVMSSPAARGSPPNPNPPSMPSQF